MNALQAISPASRKAVAKIGRANGAGSRPGIGAVPLCVERRHSLLSTIANDFLCYPATELVDDVLCGLLAGLFVVAVCGLFVGIFGG